MRTTIGKRASLAFQYLYCFVVAISISKEGVIMNVAMWGRALRIIPRLSKEEWSKLDVIARWLIATRAAVLVMTFISAAIAGIFAFRNGDFHLGRWLLVLFGLVLAHATNNLLNDLTDYRKGVDRNNYFRTQYGAQPLEQGLWTERELLTYAGITGAIAFLIGVFFVVTRGWPAALLLALGAIFVLFYTWPLKYIGLGELAVVVVWGPLMIGGGYYVITGQWNWHVVLASLPYALGPTTVIFGKHIDKHDPDKTKRIHTLPVIIGEKAARGVAKGMFILQYALVVYLVITGFFTPVMLVVLLALVNLPRVWKMYSLPYPKERPAEFPPEAWPTYFAAGAFYHNRSYGMLFILALLADSILTVTEVL
jgi:1,4-dihydroxy-2-naphthoate polyprenyltransferase